MNYNTNQNRLTPHAVEEHGQWMYQNSWKHMLCGIIGLIIFFLVGIYSVNEYDSFWAVFLFIEHGVGTFFAIISDVLILVGISGLSMYNKSYYLFALGRIAVNTEQLKNMNIVNQQNQNTGNINQQNVNQQNTNVGNTSFTNQQNTNTESNKSEVQTDADSERINKIERLRSQGMITEEEYQILTSKKQ